MFLLGLTGSIGMGKSTTAQLFVEEGCALWDADQAVHRLYGEGGAAVPVFQESFPATVLDGIVSRPALKEMIADDPSILAQIEKIVHPLVAEDRRAFLARTEADIVVLDIPLLFETGGDARVDAVVCVYIDPEAQQKRVMARGTMTQEQFEAINHKQMPTAEKRRRSQYHVKTDTLAHARAQVQAIVKDIREVRQNA
ncbi:MAG: dephospho-CoA kinase [Pseudomonadota bacterium]